MSRIINVRQENVRCDISMPDDLPIVFVDDMTQVTVGVPVSRVLFHVLDTPPVKEEGQDLIEQRKAVVQIAIPTLALVNLAKHVLTHVVHGNDMLDNGFSEYRSLLLQAVSDLQQTPPPSEKTVES